ncbi:bifunctional tetrahydrofolate synthase/dihydrofolate synthase [Thiomicrorhabdus sp. zzn3]|uniref:bifunctional tetrahydrofolate synthase/dihydrofolate synthase n=1 Tax=Thiomicrorhabdus sp. zzn3 TaxID=3039775 RepID=UPI0024366E36|nr:bifunctional tetrahydrofolate synthase/dihydrofolate synthase [Thiomicrorhabdus sp. zzn3]MDG6778344.1 bifunctional tetrahydrofolate synthase/dihydrofolate synthase [Thiomicrorhabdus sp. zzn3]
MNAPSRQSGLQAWIDWLLALHAQEIDLGIERVGQVAEKLNINRPAEFVISVSGTNGKGSSVAMLSAILKAQGYQVGQYTSPHILRFNERIQIDGQLASDQAIVEAFAEIEVARGDIKLTYFEFSTLAALWLFKQAQVDVAVLEVGLGGRLDAVNLVDADAALITAIDVDHADWLGDDRSQIAIEKAGITRSGKPAICSDPNPPHSLFAYAQQHQVPLQGLQRDFGFAKTEQAWSVFSLAEPQDTLFCKELPFPALKGEFQLQNAAGVIALLHAIRERLPVDCGAIKTGLKTAVHPGRLQSLQIGERAWLIDVAHNPQSAQALADYLAEQSETPQFVSLFSVLNDKDCVPMIRQIAPWVKEWRIADLQIPRATDLNTLAAFLVEAGVTKEQIIGFDSIKACVESVKAQDDVSLPVLVWGSFFTVSQVLEALQSGSDLFTETSRLEQVS